MTALIDGYAAALFDLDGVVYLGPDPVPGAPDGLNRLRDRGVRTGFVTNNAARTPETVAEHLRELGIDAKTEDVVTSAQAGARLLAERFGPGAKILAVGGIGVHVALAEAGLVTVASADDDPVAVMQGYGTDLTWSQINEAAIAVQRGAHWLATNTDPTRPTDRGIVPGNGTAVAAVRTAVAVDPEVAGKPYPPLIVETLRRLGVDQPAGGSAGPRAIFVGDRFDTDIAGAATVGLDSLFVLSGACGPRDLVAAPPGERPTHIGRDLNALLDPPRTVHQDGDRAVCGTATARSRAGGIELDHLPSDPDQALDALAAIARLAWSAADSGRPVGEIPELDRLGDLLRG